MQQALVRRLLAELLGTGALVASVVGSGILADRLSKDDGVALFISAIGTVSTLGVVIWLFTPVSGAHFNPAVTVVAALRRQISPVEAIGYVVAQMVGAIVGAMLGNIMFSVPFGISSHVRSGPQVWIGEVVTTIGLLLVVGTIKHTERDHLAPTLVPAWILAAGFFTSSNAFANPAVTVARMFSDTFSGIAPSSAPMFIVAEVVGATLGSLLGRYFYPRVGTTPKARDHATSADEGGAMRP